MASTKEIQPSTRPLAHHRPSLSSSASGPPGRQSSHARANSHSLLAGQLNANHRITRRKSVNASTNVTALAAALRDGVDMPATAALPIASAPRRNTMSKTARNPVFGSLPSPPPSLDSHKSMTEVSKRELHASAVDDAHDVSGDEDTHQVSKARVRRASDGQTLTKDGKKSNRVEVQCKKCGKSYKHSSCLTKHLWEHTPEWSYTSKLLISKHQQVQLLEAASVLIAMNGPSGDAENALADSPKDFPSEPESSSPAASGYSDQERLSSADTTPPPMVEASLFSGDLYRNKGYSKGMSRSYQSAMTPSALPGTALRGNATGDLRKLGDEQRPTSSGQNNTGEDDRDLAAAVELLSCSFGSNNGSHGTVTLPSDAPPVPPVPVQYLDQAQSLSNVGFFNSFTGRQPESFTRGEMRRDSIDVRMEDSGDSGPEDDDFDKRSRSRSDEEDDGALMVGRMEE